MIFIPCLSFRGWCNKIIWDKIRAFCHRNGENNSPPHVLNLLLSFCLCTLLCPWCSQGTQHGVLTRKAENLTKKKCSNAFMGFGAASVCFAIQCPMVMAQTVTRKGCTASAGAGGAGREGRREGWGSRKGGEGMRPPFPKQKHFSCSVERHLYLNSANCSQMKTNQLILQPGLYSL